jgi:prepilin-type N-terminal cleavage/methylation domain-containing protein
MGRPAFLDENRLHRTGAAMAAWATCRGTVAGAAPGLRVGPWRVGASVQRATSPGVCRSFDGRRSGFTLIEVIVAVALLTMIGAVVVGTLRNSLRARDLLAQNDGVQQSARVALERVSQELRLAYLTSATSAVNTYQTVFIAQDEDPVDSLWFTTLSHRPMYRGTHECDQTEITLWAEPDPENPSLQVLLHREAPRIDEEPDIDGVVLPLAHGVKRFDLRFLDGTNGEWLEEWSTISTETPNRLPRAIKVVLVISAPDIEEPDELVDHTFVTTILLEYAEPLARSVFALGEDAASTGDMGGLQ